jgi:hypothetical protein
MNFQEFSRPAPPLPETVSPFYYQLLEEVKGHQTPTENSKVIIFCIAYTIYSLRKKDDILHKLNIKKLTADNREVTKAYDSFCRTWTIQDLIATATGVLSIAIDDIRLKSIPDMLRDVQTTIKNTESFSLMGFFRHFVYLAVSASIMYFAVIGLQSYGATLRVVFWGAFCAVAEHTGSHCLP